MEKEKDIKSGENLDKIEEINESGGVVAKGKGENIHCLSIIGQIEGHYMLPEGQKATKYEHIIPMLVHVGKTL